MAIIKKEAASTPAHPRWMSKLSVNDHFKDLIKQKNDQLYKLQLAVLELTWAEHTDPTQVAALSAQCATLEEEITVLCEQHRASKVCPEGREGEYEQAEQVQAGPAHSSGPKTEASTLANLVPALEKKAEITVQEFRHSLPQHGGRAGIAATHASKHADHQALELEYEEVEEVEVGHKVHVICDDDHGFSRGDGGVVVAVDPSLAFPYRVRSENAHRIESYFKACDLRRVSPTTPTPICRDVTPVAVRTSPYIDAVPMPHAVDLEKGRCRLVSPQQNTMSFFHSVSLHINPLGAC